MASVHPVSTQTFPMHELPVVPRAPCREIATSAVLRRRTGRPISVQTLDLGPHGMRVVSRRPLADDEEVRFDLPNLGLPVTGWARVLRLQRPHIYVLRFERLPESMTRRLQALAQAPGPGLLPL